MSFLGNEPSQIKSSFFKRRQSMFKRKEEEAPNSLAQSKRRSGIDLTQSCDSILVTQRTNASSAKQLLFETNPMNKEDVQYQNKLNNVLLEIHDVKSMYSDIENKSNKITKVQTKYISCERENKLEKMDEKTFKMVSEWNLTPTSRESGVNKEKGFTELKSATKNLLENQRTRSKNVLNSLLYEDKSVNSDINKFVKKFEMESEIPQFVCYDNGKANKDMLLNHDHNKLREIYFERFQREEILNLVNELRTLKMHNERIQSLTQYNIERKEICENNVKSIKIKIEYELTKRQTNEEVDSISLVENKVVSGKPEELLKWTWDRRNEDSDFLTDFLYTYRIHTQPTDLLSQCISIYEEKKQNLDEPTQSEENKLASKKIMTKIVILFKKWIDLLYSDFTQPKQGDDEKSLFEMMTNFIEKHKGETGINHIENTLKAKSSPEQTIEQSLQIEGVTSNVKFLDIPSNDFADQLTLLEFALFVRIKPKELLGSGWTKKDKEVRCKNLVYMTTHFNCITSWITSVIVEEQNIKKRAIYMRKFIEIAERMYALNNYTGLFEFYSGLNSNSVGRLKKTWEEVGKAHIKKLDALKEVISPIRSYATYRENVNKNKQDPCIPFFGVFLQDLTFIDEGNNDRIQTGEVNFEKCRMLTEVIKEVILLQQKGYINNKINAKQPEVLRMILELDTQYKDVNENDLYKKSLAIEPRQQQ